MEKGVEKEIEAGGDGLSVGRPFSHKLIHFRMFVCSMSRVWPLRIRFLVSYLVCSTHYCSVCNCQLVASSLVGDNEMGSINVPDYQAITLSSNELRMDGDEDSESVSLVRIWGWEEGCMMWRKHVPSRYSIDGYCNLHFWQRAHEAAIWSTFVTCKDHRTSILTMGV